jgi:hypothetical protein
MVRMTEIGSRPRIGIGRRERGFKTRLRYLREGNGTYARKFAEEKH